MIIQEEVTVSGLFDAEDDADRVIRQYAEQYGLEGASHMETYSADVTYQGHGPVREKSDSERSDTDDPEQAAFDTFQEQEE